MDNDSLKRMIYLGLFIGVIQIIVNIKPIYIIMQRLYVTSLMKEFNCNWDEKRKEEVRNALFR